MSKIRYLKPVNNVEPTAIFEMPQSVPVKHHDFIKEEIRRRENVQDVIGFFQDLSYMGYVPSTLQKNRILTFLAQNGYFLDELYDMAMRKSGTKFKLSMLYSGIYFPKLTETEKYIIPFYQDYIDEFVNNIRRTLTSEKDRYFVSCVVTDQLDMPHCGDKRLQKSLEGLKEAQKKKPRNKIRLNDFEGGTFFDATRVFNAFELLKAFKIQNYDELSKDIAFNSFNMPIYSVEKEFIDSVVKIFDNNEIIDIYKRLNKDDEKRHKMMGEIVIEKITDHFSKTEDVNALYELKNVVLNYSDGFRQEYLKKMLQGRIEILENVYK